MKNLLFVFGLLLLTTIGLAKTDGSDTLKPSHDAALHSASANTSHGLDLKIYPNPNHGQFSIETRKFVDNYNIEVYSITGKLIYRREHLNNMKLSLDLSSYDTGIYFVRVENLNQVITKKVVIR